MRNEALLIGTQAIGSVEVLDATNAFLVEGFAIRRSVEIQVS